MGANTHNNYFSSRGGGGSSLTSAGNSIPCHAELVSASHNKEIPKPVRNDKYVSEAHSKHKPHTTHITHLTHAKNAAFTLAEVLITLAIIGIVAAMTIPTLVANYQNKAWNTSAQVFERKLEEALKTMNTQQVLAGYSSTADFVGALGKYFKITKICSNDDIMSCFEDKVRWGKNELEVSTQNVKTAAQLGQDWNTETIGVQFANGTSGILAYNPSCRENPYTNQFTGTSCISLLYDTTGFKSPNSDGKDLRYINVTEIDGHMPCSIELSDGTCFTKPFKPDPLTHDECIEKQSELGIEHCRSGDDDRWGGTVKACGGVDNLPDKAQLAALASVAYGTTISADSGYDAVFWHEDIIQDMGFDTSRGSVYIWSKHEDSVYSAEARAFNPRNTGFGYTNYLNRCNANFQAICLAK